MNVTDEVGDQKANEATHWESLTTEQHRQVLAKWPSEDEAKRFEYLLSKSGDVLWRRGLAQGRGPSASLIELREEPRPTLGLFEAERVVKMIPRWMIDGSETNPRTHEEEVAHEELVSSMRERGFVPLFPLTVRPKAGPGVLVAPVNPTNDDGLWTLLHPETRVPLAPGCAIRREEAEKLAKETFVVRYELVFGKRRYRASGTVGIGALPCIVEELDDLQVMELQLIENLQREQLDPIDEAEGYSRLLGYKHAGTGKPAHTVRTLAVRLGRSPMTIRETLLLCRLTGDFRAAVREGRVAKSTAREVARVPDEQMRDVVAKEVLSPRAGVGPLGIVATRAFIQRECTRDLRQAKFDPKDAALLPVETDELGERVRGGACTDCPRNSATQQEANSSGGRLHGMCQDVGCYAAKEAAQWSRWQAQNHAPEQGREVVPREQVETIFDDGGALDWRCGLVDLGTAPEATLLRVDAFPAGCEVPTWRELTQGRLECVQVALDPRGKTRELAELEAVKAAAEANGHKIFKTSKLPRPTTDEQHEEQVLVRKEEKAGMERLNDELSIRWRREVRAKAAAHQAIPADLWRPFLLQELEWTGYHPALGAGREGVEDQATLEAWISCASVEQLLGLFVEMRIFGDVLVPRPDILTAVVKAYRIDRKTIEEEARWAVEESRDEVESKVEGRESRSTATAVAGGGAA